VSPLKLEAASSKKDLAQKAEADCDASRLGNKGKMKTINIISTSLDVVGDQVQDILEGKSVFFSF
jgi:hypothetical protein